jgi:hypothetical protein
MKAYIDSMGKSPNGMFYAQVVTEQDYHDGGPNAHSYRGFGKTQEAAQHDCEFWCHKNGCTVASVDEVAA